MAEYRCPKCGFQVFNRRVAKCEKCGGQLPAELLLSGDEIAALDAAHQKSNQDRLARNRAGRDEGDAGGFLDLNFGGGDAGGSD